LIHHYHFRQWIDTRKLPWREKTINTIESKLAYLRQIEAFRKARAIKCCERDLHAHINEMHTYMRETELKEEEYLKQREKVSKGGRKN
jgi:hypothetical protein